MGYVYVFVYVLMENSQKAFTSERYILDIRQPDRRTPMKALTKKTFHFVEQVWQAYMATNMEDLRLLIIIIFMLPLHFFSTEIFRPRLEEDNLDDATIEENDIDDLNDDGVNIDDEYDEVCIIIIAIINYFKF